ncbi:hypothetical protein, partial [Lysinibacillus sp. D4A3_S15]|uniref:hypothetical protein n=1 Tax=Lysinibacillus sp. D4A3_S15 TaxID=2941227 RepID=UPI0020BD4DD7
PIAAPVIIATFPFKRTIYKTPFLVFIHSLSANASKYLYSLINARGFILIQQMFEHPLKRASKAYILPIEKGLIRMFDIK